MFSLHATELEAPELNDSLEGDRESGQGAEVLEVAAGNKEVEAAFKVIKGMMDSGNFKAAAEAIQKLKGATLKGVLEKVLGAAGKAASSTVTLDQLTQMVEGSLKQIPKAALDVMRNAKQFKGGKWEPKPNQPKDMYVGTEVHDKIAAEYSRKNPADIVVDNYTPMASLLGKQFGKDVKNLPLSAKERLLKPDIVNVTKKHLYEIKPEKHIANAVVERDVYITLFETAGVEMERGPQNAPGANGVVEAPGGHALYYSPLPGVILYRVKRGDFDPANLPQPFGVMRDNEAEEKETQPGTRGNPAPALATQGQEIAADEQSDVIDEMERLTGLTGLALLLYLIVSEGSRFVFPPRNLIPIP